MLNDKHYSQENILMHEFAHSVMCIGMDDEQRQSICGAYTEAKQAGLYQQHIYMMENADEYWAEATQSWFDATVRTGITVANFQSCLERSKFALTWCSCHTTRFATAKPPSKTALYTCTLGLLIAILFYQYRARCMPCCLDAYCCCRCQ